MEDELKKFDIKRLHQIQLQMLKCFIELCSRHSLRYFLVGGSCLGSVRHKGFIPWDDDIDVAMPRNDYEAFMTIAQLELPSRYFLQNMKSEPDFPMCFAKLRDSRTTFIEKSLSEFRINHGVYIDIFPLDGYRNTKCFHFRNLIYGVAISRFFTTVPIKDKKDRLIKRILRKVINLMFNNYYVIRNKQDRLYKKYNYDDSDVVVNYCGAWGIKKEAVFKEYFGTGTVGLFEGVEVILPESWDNYLAHLYGNYMKMPPFNERVCHHHCTTIDFDHPYTFYF